MDILKIDFNDIRDKVHKMAKSKGWWESDRDNAEVYALVISELYEALEAKRIGKTANVIAYQCLKDPVDFDVRAFLNHIKDSVADELAGCFIRLLDKAGKDGTEINLEYWTMLRDYMPNSNFFKSILAINKTIINIEHYCEEGKTLMIEAMTNEALLQIAFLCKQQGIDLHFHITLKMRYNSTRPHKYGKKF